MLESQGTTARRRDIGMRDGEARILDGWMDGCMYGKGGSEAVAIEGDR